MPTPLIGRKTGSTLNELGWCSGRGSGSPLTRTFAGSKLLLAAFLAGLCPYCTGVMFHPKVTAKDDHVTPPSAVIDKTKQTWAEYGQSWINYRKSLSPEPEHVPEAYKDTEEYGPEPDYDVSEELQIARLVSTHNDSWLNNNTAESLLDSPSDLIYTTIGQIRIT
jgi:hypothetical protein